MRLYINGQDIEWLILGDIDNGILKRYNVNPEEYLKTIILFLDEISVKSEDVNEVYVVVGLGSATSLRTSLTIVNIWKFVKKIRVFKIKKAVDIEDEGIIEKIKKGSIKYDEAGDYVLPEYEFSPKITVSTRDNLKRKK